jgi:transposase-like protein
MSNIDSESLSDNVISPDITPQLSEPEDSSSQIKKQKSLIYTHFILNEMNNRYNCKHCDKNYKAAKDGSTSSLWKHIKTKHNELFLEINQITDALNRLEISESLVCIFFSSFIILQI